MKNHKSNWITVTAFVAVWSLAFSPALDAGDTSSTKISKLLSNSKNLAYELQDDAATMESYTKLPELSWRSHVQAINEITLHMDDMAREVRKLDDVRELGSPWQKDAIDQINPFLAEIRQNSQQIIECLNNNSRIMNDPNYQQFLEANYDETANLAMLISRYLDYGKTKQKMDQLTRQLQTRSDEAQ